MSLEISISPRSLAGSSASRRLRRSGSIPAVIFGDDKENEMVAVSSNEFRRIITRRDLISTVISLCEEGKKVIPVLLRHVHMHPCRQDLVLHLDFQRINEKKPVQISVPLSFINEDICPGVKISAGIVNHITTNLEITCLPQHIPSKIIVDMKELTAGRVYHVSDLQLPEGVIASATLRGENPPVVTIVTSGPSADDESPATST